MYKSSFFRIATAAFLAACAALFLTSCGQKKTVVQETNAAAQTTEAPTTAARPLPRPRPPAPT